MPVVVDPKPEIIETLLTTVPPGAHSIDQLDRLDAWLENRPEEYVVVLGPYIELADALALADGMRLSRPSTSVIVVREEVDAQTMREAMHAGVRDVVPLDDTSLVRAAVDRAYQLYVALRGPGGAMHQGRVVTVFSPKGGVGKTTVSVNLALALADRGARKVCLVDLDLAFGDVAITLQLFPSHTLEHAIGSENAIDTPLLEQLLTRHADGVMVLAAPNHPDVRERVTPMLVSRILKGLRESFDYIVIDTAPAFDEQTLTALDETDECVIVATLDVPTLKNVKVALETLEMLDIARDHRHLMLNRADDNVGLGADRVEAILGMQVSSMVETSMDVAAATNAGQPLMSQNPNHPFSQSLREFSTRLTGEPVAPSSASASAGQDESEKSGRLFRRRK